MSTAETSAREQIAAPHPVAPSSAAPLASTTTASVASTKPQLTNSVRQVIKTDVGSVWRAIYAGTPDLGETWHDSCGRITGFNATGTKEPLGAMACSCLVGEELMSYAGSHDLAFGGTEKHVINERLRAREVRKHSSNSKSLLLVFDPCEVCPGTTLRIAHTITRDPRDSGRAIYTRTETIQMNDMRYFIDPSRFGNKLTSEIHVEAIRKKVTALAAELEPQWSILWLQPGYLQNST